MRLDKFTLRAQEAVQTAIELAERNQNQQVEPEHLLTAMLEQPEGIVRPILGKLSVNVAVIANDIQAAVARFPHVQGGQQYFSPRLSQVFTAALVILLDHDVNAAAGSFPLTSIGNMTFSRTVFQGKS